MKGKIVYILAGTMFIFGGVLLLHQYLTYMHIWFDFSQFWHHENIAVACFASSISLLAGRYLRGK